MPGLSLGLRVRPSSSSNNLLVSSHFNYPNSQNGSLCFPLRNFSPLAEHEKLVGVDGEASRQMFGEMSDHMRASWCHPAPGRPLVGGEPGGGEALAREVGGAE